MTLAEQEALEDAMNDRSNTQMLNVGENIAIQLTRNRSGAPQTGGKYSVYSQEIYRSRATAQHILDAIRETARLMVELEKAYRDVCENGPLH